MNIQEATIYTTAVFSDDNTKRYLLRKTWNAEAKMACIITIYPASNDIITLDLTTQLIQNALHRLNFGGFDALNITPKINPPSGEIGGVTSLENIEQIKKSAEEITKNPDGVIIIAWGSAGASNKKVQKQQTEILKLLKPFESQVYMITDGKNKNLHPLVPSLRNGRWILESFDFPAIKDEPEKEEAPSSKKRKKTKKQAESAEQGTDQPEKSAEQNGEEQTEPEAEHLDPNQSEPADESNPDENKETA
jgi:hypothetical protein